MVIYIVMPQRKQLDKSRATSILCSKELLDSSEELKCVAQNRDNVIYHVHDSNICIMHVEDGFCILVDYIINEVNIPEFIIQDHYGVYQSVRDCVKSTTRVNRLIGYDIKERLYHEKCKKGYHLDHWAETFNELDKSKRFIPGSVNQNGYSHRRQLEINTVEDLDWLCERIRDIDKLPGGHFI